MIADRAYIRVKFTLHYDKGTRPMIKHKSGSGSWEATNTINATVHGLWTGGWLLTTALAAFGPKYLWDFDTLPTVLAALLNLGIGFGMIMATIRHIRGQDEMQQKIFLNASAFALGTGIVCGCSYDLLEGTKLIAFQPEISHLIILMALTFVVAIIIGHRSYR